MKIVLIVLVLNEWIKCCIKWSIVVIEFDIYVINMTLLM